MNEVIPSPAPRIATGSWNHLLKVRPRLLGEADLLRRQAKARPELYAIVKAQDTLLSAGVVHIVEGLPAERAAKLIESAMAHIARGVTNVHQDTWIWMDTVAMVYDLFFDRIAPADRQRMIDWLNPHMDVFKDDENAFHNSTFAKIRTYLRIAYSTWAENPASKAFRDYAIEYLYRGRIVPALKALGAGGGTAECGWYARGSLWCLVEGLELARRIEGYDGFQECPAFFYHRMAYNLLETYPGTWMDGMERYSCEGDGHNQYSQAMEFPRITRIVLAEYFHGSELSKYVSAGRRKPGKNWAVYDLLFDTEQPDAPANPAVLPLAHLSEGIGKLHARGSWADDASWLRFECGPFFNQHQHQEAGNFEIFRREPLATESGEYIDWYSGHALNWLVRSIAHNCILVHQPEEQFRNIRNWKNVEMANDGGQGNNVYIVHTLEDWVATRADHERGQIIAYQDAGPVLYVVGDCTRAYAASKVELCRRHIVFLRPHLFVILDRVRSTKAEYAKTWLLHCVNEPELREDGALVTNGPGRLSMQTLLPQRAKIEKIYGYTYGGKTYDPESDRISKFAEKWRIEVRPPAPAPAKEDIFLHVLSTDGDAPAHLVTEGESIGAAGDGWQVLLDPTGRGTATVGGKTIKLEMAVKKGRFE